jgi:hypothetical protein
LSLTNTAARHNPIAPRRTMTTPASTLTTLLEGIRHLDVGFSASGALPLPAPSVIVQGCGVLSFPLSQTQHRALIAAGEHAPYGRGPKTLVDTEVRRCWQIPSEKLAFGEGWEKSLAKIVKAAAARLGVKGRVHAELYKLLLYEPGDFFTVHRDTEKAAGMFATLVVGLPSPHTGGDLVVRHAGQTAALSIQPDDQGATPYAAFYADCQHELRPVVSGRRLCLVYNLIKRRREAPMPPDPDAAVAGLVRFLKGWAVADWPAKLCAILSHDYTRPGLSLEGLKGTDAARAAALMAAAEQADCELLLGLISVEESGGAIYQGYRDSRGRRPRWHDNDDDDDDDPSDYEVMEDCIERRSSAVALQVLRGAGRLSELVLEEDEEIAPPGALEDEAFDEERFWEATGNAGGSFERSYRRAALVVWPRWRRAAVTAQANVGTAMEDARAKLASGNQQDARLVASVALKQHGVSAALLALLAELADTALIRAAIARQASGRLREELVAPLARCAVLLEDDMAAALSPIIGTSMGRGSVLCARMLVALVDVLDGGETAGETAQLQAALAEILAHLRGEKPEPSQHERWRRPPGTSAALGEELLAAMLQMDAGPHLSETVKWMAADRERWPLDGVLLPALLSLSDRLDCSLDEIEALSPLQAACLAHLDARMVEPLAPFPDWTRPGFPAPMWMSGGRKAQDALTGFVDFLADPAREQWVLAAREGIRCQVEDIIRRHQLDVQTDTLKQGTPHKLVCVKTSASYERRVKQRAADQRARAMLTA